MSGPEVIVLALCGYDVDRARRDYELLRKFPGFDSLPAAQNNRIHIVNASAYLHDPVHALSTVWRLSPAFCILKNFRSSVRVGLITS
jgi:ABC-type Fe3+-hydroxamate transport system substrate-binding protein